MAEEKKPRDRAKNCYALQRAVTTGSQQGAHKFSMAALHAEEELVACARSYSLYWIDVATGFATTRDAENHAHENNVEGILRTAAGPRPVPRQAPGEAEGRDREGLTTLTPNCPGGVNNPCAAGF